MSLYDNLIAAGLPIQSATENGEVVGLPGIPMSSSQLLLLSDICEQYLNPSLYTLEHRILDRQSSAKVFAKAIPNWAAWTQNDWTTYYNANISATQINLIANLTDAKAMLNKMSIIIDRLAKMEIALRDFTMPDLPE